MQIQFFKYQGTGNDFIILDNRDRHYDGLSKEDVAFLCDRRFGIGGDGLMLLNTGEGVDFVMTYFNSDGRESTMCGNGGRCLVRFANHAGIEKELYRFLAIDGIHEARVEGKNVALKMNDVSSIDKREDASVLDTGSPHYVAAVKDIKNFEVFEKGKAIRYNEEFKREGININFVEALSPSQIFVRTYERGVEDETFSCGTGVTAAALVFGQEGSGTKEMEVKTLGGELKVRFTKTAEGYSDIWLIGPAEAVFQGNINLTR